MTPLPLAPLPAVRPNPPRGSAKPEMEGFVDESAILALLAKPAVPRSRGHLPDLALSASDDDFAGWPEPLVQSPFRAIAETEPAAVAAVRRPSPPRCVEPGIGTAHRGNHRWWLAGIAGAVTSLLLACLLLTVARQTQVPFPSGIFESRPTTRSLPDTRPAEGDEGSVVARLTR